MAYLSLLMKWLRFFGAMYVPVAAVVAILYWISSATGDPIDVSRMARLGGFFLFLAFAAAFTEYLFSRR